MTSLRNRRLAYAQELAGHGHFAKAIGLYGVMVAQDGSDVEALLELGWLQLRVGQLHKAASAFERAGEELHRLGDHARALVAFGEVQAIAASSPELAARFAHVADQIVAIERADDEVEVISEHTASSPHVSWIRQLAPGRVVCVKNRA